ncbi:MAG: hypothetical protein V4673_14620 [Pseudomonadota bacterium]
MPTINSSRPITKPLHGKICEPVRSVTPELDGEMFDVSLAKTVVKLDDGSETIVANIELIF